MILKSTSKDKQNWSKIFMYYELHYQYISEGLRRWTGKQPVVDKWVALFKSRDTMLPAEYCEMLEWGRQRSGAILGLFHFGSFLLDQTLADMTFTRWISHQAWQMVHMFITF